MWFLMWQAAHLGEITEPAAHDPKRTEAVVNPLISVAEAVIKGLLQADQRTAAGISAGWTALQLEDTIVAAAETACPGHGQKAREAMSAQVYGR